MQPFVFQGQVLLIGGSSGTGKTTLASALSREWGIPALQVDDFRLVIQEMLEQAQSKTGTREDVWDQVGVRALRAVKECYRDPASTAEDRFQALVSVAEVMSSAVEIVIAHHIATQRPVIIEGDGLVPSLAVRRKIANLVPQPGQMQAIFLVEEDPNRLLVSAQNRDRGFLELPLPEQDRIIRASWLFGQWLKNEANKHTVPVVSSLPEATIAERVTRILQAGSHL